MRCSAMCLSKPGLHSVKWSNKVCHRRLDQGEKWEGKGKKKPWRYRRGFKCREWASKHWSTGGWSIETRSPLEWVTRISYHQHHQHHRYHRHSPPWVSNLLCLSYGERRHRWTPLYISRSSGGIIKAYRWKHEIRYSRSCTAIIWQMQCNDSMKQSIISIDQCTYLGRSICDCHGVRWAAQSQWIKGPLPKTQRVARCLKKERFLGSSPQDSQAAHRPLYFCSVCTYVQYIMYGLYNLKQTVVSVLMKVKNR